MGGAQFSLKHLLIHASFHPVFHLFNKYFITEIISPHTLPLKNTSNIYLRSLSLSTEKREVVLDMFWKKIGLNLRCCKEKWGIERGRGGETARERQRDLINL